jgi:hypothetical protein
VLVAEICEVRHADAAPARVAAARVASPRAVRVHARARQLRFRRHLTPTRGAAGGAAVPVGAVLR